MARTPLNASALNDFDQRVKNAVPGFVQKTWNDSPPSLDTVGVQAEIDAASALWSAGAGRQPVYLPGGDYNVTQTGSTVQPAGFSSAYTYALLMKSGVELVGIGKPRLLSPQVPNTTLGAIKNPTDATITVASTTGFPSSGQLQFVGFNDQINYTGKTPTTFTGCSAGSSTVPNTTGVALNPKSCMIATPAGSLTTDWAIRNILFDGQTPLLIETEQVGIFTGPARRFEITDNEFTSMLGKCIHLNGDTGGNGQTQRYRISRNHFHDCSSNAIHPGANGASDYYLTDNQIYDNRMNAESIITSTLTNFQWGTISRNQIRNWGTMDVGGTDILCEGNTINNKAAAIGAGIKLTNGARIRVVGNTVDQSLTSNSNATGISMADSALSDIVIQGNILKRPVVSAAGAAILAQVSSGTHTNIAIGGNVITGGDNAVEPDVSLANITEIAVVGNTFNRLGGVSLHMKSTALRLTFTGNSGTQSKCVFEGESAAISGNRWTGSVGEFAFQLNTTAGSSCTGNRLKCDATNGSVGVLYVTTNRHIVSGNSIEIVQASQHWIVESGSDNNLYSDNQLIGTTGVVTLVGTNSRARRNTGYISENYGATSVADGGTINHGLVATPTRVNVTPSIGSQMVSVTAKSSTTFTVAIKTDAGAAGTTQTVYWEAEI